MMSKGYGNDPKFLNFKGKHHTNEHKEHISKVLKGIKRGPHTEAWKRHNSIMMKKNGNFIENNPSKRHPKWFTNGIIDTFVPEDMCLEGFYKGRSKVKGKPVWNKGLNKENNEIMRKISEKIKETRKCKLSVQV